MRNSRISAGWLSDEMAHALAAMWPPLEATDVMRAADELTSPSPGLRLVRQTTSGRASQAWSKPCARSTISARSKSH